MSQWMDEYTAEIIGPDASSSERMFEVRELFDPEFRNSVQLT